MRISTQQQYLQSIDSMQRGQVNLGNLSEQISTGKKLVNPSDDPVAAAQVVKLERELAQNEKYDDNINVTQRRLELEETILDDINTAIDRMRELSIQAGNGIMGNQDRAGIATELYQLTEYVAGLMNTQDTEGEYLFAGSKGSTKPYTEASNGRYEYNGDDGQRLIQVSSELLVPSNDSGQYLFEAVEGPLQVSLSGQAVFNANLPSTPQTEPFMKNVTFADSTAEDSFKSATQGLGDLTIRVVEQSLGDYVYSVVDNGGNPVEDESGNPITDRPVVGDLSTGPVDVNLHGMQFELHAPADPSANEITINASAEAKNVLDVALDLADVLSQPIAPGESRATLEEAVATGIAQFEQAAERTLEARTSLGSRLKTLENVSSSNLDFKLLTETALSTLVDANLDEVIREFKLQETTLQAAQATFGRLTSLSLFNYLN